MAKLQRSITAMLLMLVMLLTLAFPALAAAGETIWQGNDVSLSFVRGEDPYVYAIAQDPANNRWYYETSNHTLLKEVTGGGAVHIFPIVDTTKVTGPWDPEGIYQSGISNYDVMYCCDAVTGTDGEIYYKRVNLEDSEYVSEADVKKLRAIISNAYPYVSVEEAKAALKEAGFAQADELDRSELIAATQAAIWTIANPDSGDSYRYNKTATTAQKLIWGGYMHEFAGEITNFTDSMTSRKYLSNPNGVGDRINALIDFYLAMKDVEAEDGQIVITSLNIVDSKLFGSDKEYKVDINVELNHGADEDDTVEINVYVGDTLAETVAVTDAKAYSFSVEAVENDDIRVVVSGTQNLERGVYFYVPKPADVDGDGIATSREVSQNLIGVASGETPVYATAAVTITDGKIINKTTIPLYEDKFADVTLEVNGKVEYKPDGGVDIVIALGAGMASYQNTYDSVISLVEPLIEKGINVKLGLIAVEHYDDVAMELTALTAESYKETITNGLAKIKEMPAGPTNLHGNILAAKAMLDADETVPAENKFFYVIATGRTYNFDNANGVPTTIINKVSINGSTYYYWGHYLWQSQRGQHTSLYRVPASYNNDFAAFWADVEKWVEADGDKYAYSFPNYDVTNDQWFNEYMNENSTDVKGLGLATSRYGWVIKALTDSGVEAIGSGAVPQNALNYERAQYEAYYAYKSMVDAGYTCQALCSENVAYQNYSPYMTTQNATPGIQLGHSFMDHMAKLSGQEASTLLFNLLDDNGNYEMLTDFFQKIDISKLTLEKASAPFVEDYIGFGEDYDFDFTGLLEKLVLKLDGEAYFTSVLEAAEGATASYGFSKEEGGKLSFRVDYFKGNEPTEERFVWYFYETVAEDSVVTLTYQLELVKRNEKIGTHIAETNQIAVLYPTGDRTYGQLFPVPEVTYSNYPDLEGEKKSEQIGSNRFEISIEVPGGGLDPKHDEIILMVDGSYSLDDEWPAMKEAIELIGKTVLNGNGNSQLTLMAFGMGDNVVLEHVKSVDDLVAALGVLPGTLLYGRSSTNCEVGFVGVAEYIKNHDDSLGTVDVIYISDGNVNTDETPRAFDTNWKAFSNASYGYGALNVAKAAFEMFFRYSHDGVTVIIPENLPAAFDEYKENKFADCTTNDEILEKAFAGGAMSDEDFIALADKIWNDVYAAAGLTAGAEYPISIVERAFVDYDNANGTHIQEYFYYSILAMKKKDTWYPDRFDRAMAAAEALAELDEVSNLYVVDYDGYSAWMDTGITSEKAAFIKSNGVQGLCDALAGTLDELSKTPYNDVVITDYMSKWVLLDSATLKIVDVTTGEIIWSAAEGWLIDEGRPTSKEIPVIIELVDSAEYAAGGNDVIGNSNGDIYKLTWYVKDGALLRCDNYKLVYEVDVDTKEDGYKAETIYPANGNTDINYTDANGKRVMKSIKVPNVVGEETKTTPPTITFKPGQASNISFMLIDKATGKVEFLYKIDIENETSFEIPTEEGKISAVFVKQSTSGMFWFAEEVDEATVQAVVECLKANNPSYKGHNAVCFGAGDHTLEFKKNKFATYTFAADTVVTDVEDKPVVEDIPVVEEQEKDDEPVVEEPETNNKNNNKNNKKNNKNKNKNK